MRNIIFVPLMDGNLESPHAFAASDGATKRLFGTVNGRLGANGRISGATARFTTEHFARHACSYWGGLFNSPPPSFTPRAALKSGKDLAADWIGTRASIQGVPI